MRNILLTLAVCGAAACCLAPPAARALTASEAFAKAPARVFPTVDSLTRLDMLDYFNSGSPKASRNLLRGDCRVTAVSDIRLEFSSSDVSAHTLQLLPTAKGDTVIMRISTISTPADDSSVSFYDKSWRPLESLMREPELDDWLTEEGKKERRDVENAVPFILSRASFDPETSILTITCHPEEYLPEEALPVAKRGLRESLSYRWDGKKMTPLK